MIDIAVLAALEIGGLGPPRQSSVPEAERPEGHAESFDDRTLFYDAVWTRGRVHLVCPKLNNVETTLIGAKVLIDGTPAPLRRLERHARHDIATYRAPVRPERLIIRRNRWQAETPVSIADNRRFAGRNCAVLVSRDNRLDWIREWVSYHVALHRLEGLIFIDNGSAKYGLAELREALAGLGLRQATVVSAPFPFGPMSAGRQRHSEKFLKTALPNVARLRWLSRARAVLVCDLDEMMHAPGTTVFDLARRTWLGYLRIPGAWRYPDADADDPTLQSAHTRRRIDERASPGKYCIVPRSPLGGFQWGVHTLEGVRSQDRFLTDRACFFHCYATTTAWKESRSKSVAASRKTVPDPEAEAAFARFRAHLARPPGQTPSASASQSE